MEKNLLDVHVIENIVGAKVASLGFVYDPCARIVQVVFRPHHVDDKP